MPIHQVNLAEAKAKLSHYARLAEAGDIVVICDRGKPIARMTKPGVRPFAGASFGAYSGQGQIADDAFDPMSDEEAAELGLAPDVRMVAEKGIPFAS